MIDAHIGEGILEEHAGPNSKEKILFKAKLPPPLAINDIPIERSNQDQIQKRELKNLSQVRDKYSSYMI